MTIKIRKMLNWKSEITILFVSILVQFSVLSTFSQTDQNLQISLLTCSPGKEIYSIYGHNAIRIRERGSNFDYVYNYGTFDFNTPGFALKFMRGKLPYRLSINNYNRFLDEYNYLHRDVTEQVLQTDSVSAARILNFLTENYKPENREYIYDFFFDNCATRLRDVINAGWDGNIRWNESKSSGKTFRTIIKEYQEVWPWLDFGVDLIIGAVADKTSSLKEEMFIPDYLMYAIRNCEINKSGTYSPISIIERNILSFNRNDKAGIFSLLWHPITVFLFLLILELLFLYKSVRNKRFSSIVLKRYDTLWFLLLGMAGTVMLFMWFGTDHQVCGQNWNVLWTVPVIPLLAARYLSAMMQSWLTYLIWLLAAISIVNSIPGIQILPQYFHPVVGLIGLTTILKLIRKKNNGHV
jgi:hypothetical protein